MKKLILILTVLFAVSALADEHSEDRKLDLSAQGIKELDAECGAGSLTIVGVKGLKDIEVKAEINLKGFDDDDIAEFIEDRVRLTLKKDGSRAYLVSTVKNRDWGWGRKSAWINLEIKVPYEMDLTVNDGSGGMEIENIGGNLDIEDGSGSITLEGIGGDLRIDDGSGSISVEDVGGEVEIDDGSGSIDVYDVAGKVTIDDGSGGIKIDKVDNDVHIKDAGSGGVSVRNVSGKVTQN